MVLLLSVWRMALYAIAGARIDYISYKIYGARILGVHSDCVLYAKLVLQPGMRRHTLHVSLGGFQYHIPFSLPPPPPLPRHNNGHYAIASSHAKRTGVFVG